MVCKDDERKERAISLKEFYKEDAEEVKAILIMFSSEGQRDAEIIYPGRRKDAKDTSEVNA